jgi:hypothetical protein
MSIKRYDLFAGAFEDRDGDWIKLEDHKTEIKRLRFLLTQVREQCKKNGYWHLECSDSVDKELRKR